MTRFLAEQLSTAHWFDQRRTRELLDWTPAVSLDEGLGEAGRALPAGIGKPFHSVKPAAPCGFPIPHS